VRCDPHEKGDDHFKVAILYTRISEDDRDALIEFVDHDLQQQPPED